MTKNDRIINIIFNTIGIRLNKSQLNSSTINSNGIYSVEPNFRRKENYWHLVLINNRQKKLFVFEIPENHKVYDELYKRSAEGRYRLLFDIDDMSFEEIYIELRKQYKGKVGYRSNFLYKYFNSVKIFFMTLFLMKSKFRYFFQITKM